VVTSVAAGGTGQYMQLTANDDEHDMLEEMDQEMRNLDVSTPSPRVSHTWMSAHPAHR